MKSDVLHNNLVAEVKKRLPPGANMAATLSDVLCLGREAIYRRLRGKVPFTFAEVAQISSKFGISLNDIVESSVSDGVLFRLYNIRFLNQREYDYAHNETCINILKEIENDPRSQLGSSSNSIPQHLLIPYETLGRFTRLKWHYQQCYNEPSIPLHDISMPDRVKQNELDYIHGINNIKTATYIWDSMIFQYVVNDIKYFMRIGLIREKEMHKLKDELLQLVDDIEKIAMEGLNAYGNKVHIYITNTNFETTYTYAQGYSRKLSFIRVFNLNTLTSTDERMFDFLKKWILSLRRLSVSISECCEMHRILSFRKQRKLIETF